MTSTVPRNQQFAGKTCKLLKFPKSLVNAQLQVLTKQRPIHVVLVKLNYRVAVLSGREFIADFDAMPLQKTFKAPDRSTWRSWLASNHASENEVRVIYQKKHTGEPCISYEDSVEKALCFGWIDSVIKRIDDNSYARKFTPRTNIENWSELNKKRVAKCVQEGRMTEIGRAKIPYANPENYRGPASSDRKSQRPQPSVPPFMSQALRANAKAWMNFSAMPPSHQRNYILWITMAKRIETREKRLKEAIRMLHQNKQLGLK